LNELRRELDRVNYELNVEKAAHGGAGPGVSGDAQRYRDQLLAKNRELNLLKKSMATLR
jgi:hypothetical protein